MKLTGTLRRTARSVVLRAFRQLGYLPVPLRFTEEQPQNDVLESDLTNGLSPESAAIWEEVRIHTMTSPARVSGLIDATRYICEADIPGAIVECGVWRGGSMMAVARTLLELGVSDRELFLFDTFAGMTEPTSEDSLLETGGTAATMLELAGDDKNERVWAYAPLDEVRKNLLQTGYDEARLHFVVGPVEDTIPDAAPEQIALLRLDTDWYQSTKHEFVHLYPRLVRGGVLILDDYGHWQGARQATDEYFADHGTRPLLMPLDQTGRIAIKAEG